MLPPRRQVIADRRPWPPVLVKRKPRPGKPGPKLVCTLVCGDLEVEGTLHDAHGGPVLAPFHGERIYRADDAVGVSFLRLDQHPNLPEQSALVDRARAAGWSILI